MKQDMPNKKTGSKTKKYLKDIFSGRQWIGKLIALFFMIVIVFAIHFGIYYTFKDKTLNVGLNWIGFISPTFNKGIAYGNMFQNPVWVFLLEGVISFILLIFFLIAKQKKFYIPLVAAFAGGVANLANRIVDTRGVFDYIRVSLGAKFLNFVANVPDIFIFCGAVSLAIGLIIYAFTGYGRSKGHDKKQNASKDSPQ